MAGDVPGLDHPQLGLSRREVVKEAPALNAASVILAHNHPSGGIQTRKEDLEFTRTL